MTGSVCRTGSSSEMCPRFKSKHVTTPTSLRQRLVVLMDHGRRTELDTHLREDSVRFHNLSISIFDPPHFFLRPKFGLFDGIFDRLWNFLHGVVHRSLPRALAEQQTTVVAEVEIRYGGMMREVGSELRRIHSAFAKNKTTRGAEYVGCMVQPRRRVRQRRCVGGWTGSRVVSMVFRRLGNVALRKRKRELGFIKMQMQDILLIISSIMKYVNTVFNSNTS